MTLGGKFEWQLSLTRFVESRRDYSTVSTEIEIAASSTVPFGKLEFRDNLTPYVPKNYSVNASEEVWINVTASAEIKVKIEEGATTVVVGDCRNVYVFSWVRQSISVKTKFDFKLTYETSNMPSRASFILTVEGPGLRS